MHPIISKNNFGIRTTTIIVALVSLVASLLGLIGASSATAAPVSSGVTTAYYSAAATKTTTKKKAKRKIKKKVVKPAAPVYAAIAGIDPRCQIVGRALCANKSANRLFVVDNGVVTASFDARFGRPGYDTPTGVFRIGTKVAMDWSHKHSVRMPWTMYFYAGYAIHYSDEFAAVGYATPPGGSHGCINLRDMTAAERLFGSTAPGTKVVIYWQSA